MPIHRIQLPDDTALAALCVRLIELGPEIDRSGQWPAKQLRLCAEAGVFEWFLDSVWGGQGWGDEQVVRGYLALSAACLTTTFVITQRTGACRRIDGCQNEALKQRLLPGLASGELFATVGISHLTTSRRHLAKPVLTAEAIAGGFRLDGMAPWVTGGAAADIIVIAATLVERGEPTDRQLIVAVPTDLRGVAVAAPLPLIGVSASSTGPVHLDGVEISDDWLIAGPVANVMASGLGASTGGFETSTLAIGLAKAAVDFLAAEAAKREDLMAPMLALRSEHTQLVDDLLASVAAGDSPAERRAVRLSPRPISKESIRQRANSLALRKSGGVVGGEGVGLRCRTPGRAVVSRGALLLGVELSAAGGGGEPV